MADYHGYRTAADAGRILRRPLESLVDARLPRIVTSLANRGDVVLVKGIFGRASLALVEGAMLVGVGESRLERLPRSAALAAWKV